jgi:hypothetical protein
MGDVVMEWMAGGVANAESGHDIVLFRRAANAEAQMPPWRAIWRATWRAIWRTMTFEPPNSPPVGPAE